ncbi:MAG: excinuclease ABC subunit B [Candidatus Yonathbacteria bacterium RIFCSPHIGHO2_01_FULL_44_41]|uniref:UvrABC system protein B n=1 Tax=Candidatus Yonathbacteria bacterium RIFCSPHIGHO2_02_FULL_44_14 TaxID=1802724 RepID=A0A1G2SAE2_9BACT|nr:MAG: excinuclease ABC subunit B [Candidatus Yonathbacteria bacterium RIFCSPHIGHO2_01_FULL_44_41]OHA81632.1 MAG: excinuclease ABC subunit B [Candidatus Yonathbacteria bacterium RIFCSPHIGHO2_02_FULL_44_14]OHA81813.1 MAG: excinuclease ABC subunit B [Candidatus Yonathbacteria bacterium RIFCSPLOWO2_01_FULL_43_20]
MEKIFKLKSDWPPAGDQPKAIKELLVGLKKGMRAQTLLGVTGSGKTFTMANVIASVGKPTLVIAHNKTLAAQLAQEYKEFFPNNAVHYFVSYYDYYQPEAYMPTTDTYIEKDAQINEEIDRLRHASTQALLTRKDVIIVASVSCIYGLGSPAEYEKENMKLSINQKIDRKELMQKLINIHFTRTNADLTPGTFRSIGSLIEIMPVSEKIVWSITMCAKGIESINKVDPISQKIIDTPSSIFIFPAKHFITNEAEKSRAMKVIKKELDAQLKKFEKEGKLLEAERLKRRTTYDLAMIREVGYCNGIENYSRHMSGRSAGSAPDTLLSYFPKTKDGKPDFLTIIDESHVTIPQIGGMYAGDQSRKKTLVEFGFRLPSAMDNRPLRAEEFHERVGQMIFTSATPSVYEKENSEQVVEQVIRPTGLIDPEISIRPILARPNFSTAPGFKKSKDNKKKLEDRSKGAYPGQIQDLIAETKKAVEKGGRVIATTLTKKMAEDLSEYLKGEGIKAEYVHSDIKTLERIQILTAFRKGTFDCLVGVNLLREGLDLPEVTLIGILDADKEGFLRSETSLIQIIGRAARNVEGRVILYAEKITGSIERAVSETNRRRAIQIAYNKEYGITPKTIIKQIKDITEHLETDHMKAVRMNLDIDAQIFIKDPQKLLKLKEKEMSKAVKELDFETAAILRDEIVMLKEQLTQ